MSELKPVIEIDPNSVRRWNKKRRELEAAGYIVVVRKGDNPPPLTVVTPTANTAIPVATDDGFNLPDEEAA